MFIPGLVSVTFRQLSPREIIDLCVANSLKSIEWGGDVHVPPGDLAKARDVATQTADAGLTSAAYGSYYRVFEKDGAPTEFTPFLETAVALGIPTIRVWAGQRDSALVNDADFIKLVDRLRQVADSAAKAEVQVALEFHGGTYTDNADSAIRLVNAVGHQNLQTLWQTPVGLPHPDCVESLRLCLGEVSNLHVFHWTANGDRLSLADALPDWDAYLDLLATDPRPRHLLLEFVSDNDPANLPREAETLCSLIQQRK
ncbi:MAG: TIM barrel protein [Chthoniobacterales bacterium]